MYKLLLVVLFIAAVISLFAGLFFILRDRGHSSRTVRSLGWRVLFCALLLAVLLFGLYSGLITPNQPFPT